MKKYAITSLIALSLIILFSSEAFARFGRGRIFRGRCAVSCCAPVVVHEVVAVQQVAFAYPVLVPAYQFQYVPPAVVAVPAVSAYPTAGYPAVQSYQ